MALIAQESGTFTLYGTVVTLTEGQPAPDGLDDETVATLVRNGYLSETDDTAPAKKSKKA